MTIVISVPEQKKEGEQVLPQAKYLLCSQRPQEGAIKICFATITMTVHVDTIFRAGGAFLLMKCGASLLYLP